MTNQTNRPAVAITLPKGSPVLITLITAFLLFFAAVPNEITALISLVLTFSVSAWGLRSRLLAALIGIPTVLGFLTYSSFLPTASLVAAIAVIGLGAYAMLNANKIFVAISVAAAYGASLVFTGSPVVSAVMLPYVIGSLLLAVGLAKQMKRSSSVCLAATGFLAGFVILIALALRGLIGSFDGALFAQLIDEIHGALLETFRESVALLDASVRPLMTEEVFNAAFDSLLCTLPAIVILSATVLIFLAQVLTFTLCSASDSMKDFPEEKRVLILSPVTAVVYVASLLLLILAPYMGKNAELLLWTAQNMTLILIIPMVIIGGFGIIGFLSRNKGCLNVWVIIGLVLLLIYSRGIVLYPVSLIGVYLTFRVNRQYKL